MNKQFPIISVCREDIASIYSDDPVLSKIAEQLTDEHMETIADKLADFTMFNWFEDIDTIMKDRILDDFKCGDCGELVCCCGDLT